MPKLTDREQVEAVNRQLEALWRSKPAKLEALRKKKQRRDRFRESMKQRAANAKTHD